MDLDCPPATSCSFDFGAPPELLTQLAAESVAAGLVLVWALWRLPAGRRTVVVVTGAALLVFSRAALYLVNTPGETSLSFGPTAPATDGRVAWLVGHQALVGWLGTAGLVLLVVSAVVTSRQTQPPSRGVRARRLVASGVVAVATILLL